MGEVYRGRDATLNRDVAIKVLPAAMAAEPERLARFKREAQVLAALNHPNIAHVHGFEAATLEGGSTVHFLAMEMVEGEDLAERLKRGAIPVDEAIAIAKQIAEGLEEAHERGIVHRDLKPANVKVTPDGKVKILDFGLAKAMEGDASSSAVNSQLSHSPTMSRHMTEAGMIMGTAAYMSPEQARGKTVDKRTDIWAFGVVLFEMLTGQRLFAGETLSDTLAAVLKEEIPWARLAGDTPRRTVELLRSCLERDPRQRMRDIGQARLVLERADNDEASAAGKPAQNRLRREIILPWVIAASLAAALLGLGLTQTRRDARLRPVDSARLEINLGVEASHEPTGRTIAMAPDGSMLAFVGRGEGVERRYIRRMGDLTPVALAGTEDARHPFFSPDGQWLGFFTDGKLKRIAVQGGEVTTIADAPIGRGGSWGDDGNIYFTPTSLRRDESLERRRCGNHGDRPLEKRRPDRSLAADPARQQEPAPDQPLEQLVLRRRSFVLASIETGARQVVASKGYFGRYVASGHLVYMSSGHLLGAPFDLTQPEDHRLGPAFP